MTRFGYTLMTEQSGPKALVDYIVQVGDAQQQRFVEEIAEPLLAKLRAL